MTQPSILDERLAEIDRRLRSIQSGLATPETAGASGTTAAASETAPVERPLPPPTPLRAAPPPADPDPFPEPDVADVDAAHGVPTLVDDLRELTRSHERLLELHRELLTQYAELLQRRAQDASAVSVTAGPFETTGAVRAFEQALMTLPVVAGVSVREYVDGDRVMVDVQLAGV